MLGFLDSGIEMIGIRVVEGPPVGFLVLSSLKIRLTFGCCLQHWV
jgi:hypothetical protein